MEIRLTLHGQPAGVIDYSVTDEDQLAGELIDVRVEDASLRGLILFRLRENDVQEQPIELHGIVRADLTGHLDTVVSGLSALRKEIVGFDFATPALVERGPRLPPGAVF